MARRRSSLEDLLTILSHSPWWVSVALAGIAFVVLRSIANWDPGSPDGVDGLGGVIARQYLIVVVGFGQYVVPAILGLAALASLVGRSKRRRLNSGFIDSGGETKALSWLEFEQLVGEIFRNKGYRVVETDKGPDGGVDLVLRRDSETYLVQCKHWKARTVNVKVVRELKGVIAARAAAGGAVVTSGEFTRDAVEFAKQAGVDVIGGQALRSLAVGSAAVASAPNCPRCGSEMVRRQAKRGARAGEAFLGCARFPECRGTVAIES